MLPFIALQARLGRKVAVGGDPAEVPVIFVAFDLLGLVADGTAVDALLREPLEERRRRLEALASAAGRFAAARSP